MFFDKNKAPIAVFYTEHEYEAIDLFCKIYRNSWLKLKREYTLVKEKDIREEETLNLELPRRREWPSSFIEELAVIKLLRPLVQ